MVAECLRLGTLGANIKSYLGGLKPDQRPSFSLPTIVLMSEAPVNTGAGEAVNWF